MNNQDIYKLIDRLDVLAKEREGAERAAFDWLSKHDPEVATLVVDAFDDQGVAASWLVDELPALGHEKPLVLLARGERNRVINCINQIRFGVIS